MSELIQDVLNGQEKSHLPQFVSLLRTSEKRYFLRNEILQFFEQYCQTHGQSEQFAASSQMSKLIYYTQEIILDNENVALIIRPEIATQQAYRLLENLTIEPIAIEELLDLRDRFVNRSHPQDGDTFEIDFGPFYDFFPKIRDPKNIGKGVEFLNRFLSSKLFQDPTQWQESLFQFMRLHRYNGLQLLINDRIQSQQQLSAQVKHALRLVDGRKADEPYSTFRFDLQNLGFEPGWGNTAARIKETLELLDRLIDAPDHQALEALVSRIPMVFKIVLVSPHGWFGQEGVLGRPDTGGQVVYILDQVKGLEQQIQEDLELAGLAGLGVSPKVIVLTRLIPNSDGTLCNQRLEKIHGTDDAWILRVPFRDLNTGLTQDWISRFEIWPYLETFAVDAERELRAEFKGKPDLIIGNYSDGNLVAFLLSRRWNVTHCIIAHALEKSKYLFSNLYWQDLEDKYHFSLQFTADLIAMNASNFIISSTYQEIVGTSESVGQYESYKSFTMPELYHVVNGVELFSPKFNVVPPGVNETVFFPYNRAEGRLLSDRERLETMLFTEDNPDQIFGKLDDPNKRPLFSMARLDRIKNLTGLAELYGKSKDLQEQCNLILIAGKLQTSESTDHEEISEIEKLYQIIDEYKLEGKIRWLGVRLPKVDTGEVYRVIADRQGIFVQPALFEAFGLTVLESMITGLPTFATQFGGPLEIIQNGVNGFYINPTQHDEVAAVILEFLKQCEQRPEYWSQIAQQGIDRVYSTYTWKIHTTRLLSLSKIYGFWNFISHPNREDKLRYAESLFHLLYKPRAQKLLEAQQQQ